MISWRAIEMAEDFLNSGKSSELDLIISSLFNVSSGEISGTRRASTNFDNRMDSALSSHISEKIQTKALPLALRKRLLYERAISEKGAA